MPDIPLPERALAVVGFACRVPGAADSESFWRNLRDGRETISVLSEDELRSAGVAPERFERTDYVRAAGVLADIDRFDAAFFGMAPAETAILDPQHRVFLETCSQALEFAGYDPSECDSSIGVYAGAGESTYLLRNVLPGLDLDDAVATYRALLGNEKDHLCTRVAHRLNLRGPAMSVQTACSSSLMAVHVAGQALLGGECDIALAGGVSIRVPQHVGYRHRPGMILSHDGHCRAFDARASGTVGGAGAGVVVLRRFEDAVRDRDTIHAVVLGSAANNDGALRGAYAAPSPIGQAAAIAEALAVAGVEPATIEYVEAHGTATKLGDAVEIDALNQVFGRVTDRRIAIGSVKTNIGHLDAAAGVIGLIKTVLAIRASAIPPTVHFEHPHPMIAWHEGPMEVCSELRAWNGRRRAGVSSFGIGGTNVHVVLQAHESIRTQERRTERQLLVLSAQTPEGLAAQAKQLSAYLAGTEGVDLADVAWTLQAGRRALPYRAAIICADQNEASAALASMNLPTRPGGPPDRRVRTSADDPADGEGDLERLAADWRAGDRIAWRSLHRTAPRRIPLPLREFERSRHWMDPPSGGSTLTVSSGLRPPAPGAGLLVPSWTEAPIGPQEALGRTRGWIVITTSACEGAARALGSSGARVIVLRSRGEFALRDNGSLVLEPTRADDWARLLNALDSGGARCDRFVLSWPAGSAESSAPTASRVRSSLADLAAFLQGMVRAHSGHRTELLVTTERAQDVSGNEVPQPESSALAGACRAIAHELPQVRLRLVDFGNPPGEIAERLIDEMHADDGAVEVAWRGLRRWVPAFVPAPANTQGGRIKIRQEGVYWITGGGGGIGFTIARHLVRTYRAKLVLTSRTLGADGNGRFATRLKELESEGGEILVRRADVSDADAMREVHTAALTRFGRIDGVVHAAGVPGDRLLRSVDRDDLARVLAPKVDGALVLDALFHDRLDFMLLCSSLAAHRGGVSQFAYAAANAFLEGFARARFTAGKPTIAVAWGAWKTLGMAAEMELPAGFSPPAKAGGIAPEEGIRAFERVLALGLPSILVQASDKSVEGTKVPSELDSQSRRGSVDSAQQPGVELPSTEIERLVARHWQERLGVPAVGRNDDFFALGGDSLLALDLIARLRQDTGIELSPDRLLAHPTVAGCAALIESLLDPSGVTSTGRSSPSSLLVPLQAGEGTALFLVHPIGGYVSVYRELTWSLGTGLTVVGIRAPDPEDESVPAAGTVESIAAAYIRAIRSQQPRGPYLLGGASFGGMVAYEMARQLSRAGEQVPILAMLDAPGPGHMPPRLASEEEVESYLVKMAATPGSTTVQHSGMTHRLSNPTREHLWSMFTMHADAMHSYRPESYSGSIVFFRARERDAHNPEHPEAGWLGRAAAGMEVVEVPGNHVTMIRAPHVAQLGRALRSRIDGLPS